MLIEVQQVFKKEVTVLTTIVAQKYAEIIALKTGSDTQIDKADNSSGELKVDNAALHEKVKKLETRIDVMTEKNDSLTQ